MNELSTAHPSKVREYIRRNEWRKPTPVLPTGLPKRI